MSNTSKNSSIWVKLGFIKYLYSLGISQSTQPRPMNSACLLTFHDAVEWFMLTACKEAQVKFKAKPTMGDYFQCYEEKSSKNLAWKEGIIELNKHRRLLKHDGIFPSEETIVSIKTDVSRFLEDNTSSIFGVEFESLSMVDLVSNETIKRYLQSAAENKSNGSLQEAIQMCAIAFHTMVQNFQSNVTKDWDTGAFRFGDHFTVERALGRNGNNFSEVNKFSSAYNNLAEAVAIISTGIDYRKYIKFMMITPNVTLSGGDSYSFHSMGTHSKITEAEFQFCYDFVIEAALELQQFEIDPDTLSTTRTIKKVQEWEKKAKEEILERQQDTKVEAKQE